MNVATPTQPAPVNVGDSIPALEIPPITRAALALYAGASGDHNPLHIDSDFARRVGFDDVFAHGMLNMGYLGRVLTEWRPQAQLRRFSVRFQNITQVHDAVICQGRIKALEQNDGGELAILELSATNQTGAVLLSGEAVVALN